MCIYLWLVCLGGAQAHTSCNDITRRPHNSGHFSLEACEIDQFEMHLRAIAKLPCPPPSLRVQHALMVNVLGRSHDTNKDTDKEPRDIIQRALGVPGATVHWYGKEEERPGRKLAHITLTASSEAELVRKADALGVCRYGCVTS